MQITEVQQVCCEQSDELAALRRDRDVAAAKRDEQADQLLRQCQELADLRAYRERYDDLQEKNKKLEEQVDRLEESGEEKEHESQSLIKKLRVKEKELQR